MNAPFTLRFENFWRWLTMHPNCVLRAGTPEAVLYDDDDLHWYIGAEGEGTLLAQVLRGKRLLGELLLDPEQVAYVQVVPPETEGEHVFELISEAGDKAFAAYFFVLTHGFEEGEDPAAPGRVH